MHHKFEVNGEVTLTLNPVGGLEENLLEALISKEVVVERLPGTSRGIIIKPKTEKSLRLVGDDSLDVD